MSGHDDRSDPSGPMPGFLVIWHLRDGAMDQDALVRTLGIASDDEARTLSRVLEDLEHDGLVQASGQDRSSEYSLTDAGRKAVQEAQEMVATGFVGMMTHRGEEE